MSYNGIYFSVALDKYVSVLDKLDCLFFVSCIVFNCSRNRLVNLVFGLVTRAADIIAYLVVLFGRFDIQTDTVNNRPFGIGKRIIEYYSHR